MQKLINLTPHALHIITEAGTITIPPSGQVARVRVSDLGSLPPLEVEQPDGSVVAIPGSRRALTELEGVPEPRYDGSKFIVSMACAERTDRLDVFAPGDLVRDSNGRIIGCKGLVRWEAS